MKNRTIIQFALLIFIVMTSSTIAENTPVTGWEFSDDRQPNFELLRPTDVKVYEVGCSRWVNLFYDNYANLHPKFRPYMHDQSMRKKWRKSLVLSGDGYLRSRNICFYRGLSERISKLPYDQRDRIIFCGTIARGLNDQQLSAAKAAEELTEYALTGLFSAVVTILNKEGRFSTIKLNDDVRYYQQQMINHVTPPSDSLRDVIERFLVPDAGKALSPERRKFVDEAFKRRDYKAVLATTAPCKP